MDTEQAFSPYMDGLKWLHTKFSARKIGVRQKPHMEMKELVYVFAQSCFIEKSFTLQVVHFLFGASRMMVQDEMKEVKMLTGCYGLWATGEGGGRRARRGAAICPGAVLDPACARTRTA